MYNYAYDEVNYMKVFIDGREGTTGLRIYERLSAINGVELMLLPDELRKDTCARHDALNSCDIAVLCLPDAAAIEAVGMIENKNVRVIDASTAHRTAPGWAYGFPELSEKYLQDVKNGARVAVPGCHAGGFIALIQPLVARGIISPKSHLSCFSLTGYSGGGKKMIAEYENVARSPLFDSPRQYAMTQEHKHLREMTHVPGLETPPIFCPVVSGFYSGMEITVPLFAGDLCGGATADTIKSVYANLYTGGIVSYTDDFGEGGFAAANAMSGLDSMEITVTGNGERILLISRFDNLGKGASGAAVECFNIMTGTDKCRALKLK